MSKKLLALFFLLGVTGCAIITMPLISPSRPLEERVIAGEGEDKILLLDISGVISMEEESRLGGIKKEPSLVARVKDELKLAQEDEHIKALVLRINSPGGMVTASDILHHEITQFKQQTGVKVVACLMELGTSGAYYVATSADKIIAHPTTVTGSIGVMVLKLNLTGLMQKVGVEEESIKSGDKKDILFPFRSITPEEREIVQRIVGQLYERFLEVIREGRPGIDRQQLKQVADGRILSSREALKAGLVDQIGYLDEAIEVAKQLAGLPSARVIIYQPPLSYKGNIYAQTQVLNPQTGHIQSYLSGLLPRLNPCFMYLWLP
jgi:protease-4